MNCLAKTKMKYSLDHPRVSEIDSVKADLKIFNKDATGNLNINIHAEGAATPKSYWIVLQDWSSCSLKCGGGKSYKQKQCVRPKGATDCLGPAIEVRDCNMEPCPGYIQDLDKEKKNTVLTPIVKVLQISNKESRFEV